MLFAHARDAAHQWVVEEASNVPGFYGAFFAGSTNWLPLDCRLPEGSDIDIKVILDAPTVTDGPQKMNCRGVVLDVSYAPREDFQSAEAVLGSYYTAGHFSRSDIIADPSGQLRRIQPSVVREFARRKWVRMRCEHARTWQQSNVPSWPETAPIHDHVLALLLAICVSTHTVLVANLQNPTIRRSLVAFRAVLEKYDHGALHETLLALLGSTPMDRIEVEDHLATCLDAFDAAAMVATTPFFGSTMNRDFARPLAVEGARELISGGFQREAMLWIMLIHSWSVKSLHLDASDEARSRYSTAYMGVLGSLGIATIDDLVKRRAQLDGLLEENWRVTEEILATNPAIKGEISGGFLPRS